MYKVVRIIISFALRVFFRKISSKGHALVSDGPLIVVANHPNVLLDPFLLGYLYPRPLHFLAKSTFFRSKVARSILTRLHVTPVYRRQDNPDELHRNVDTFRHAVDVLRSRGAVMIFPEGVSKARHRIEPLKSGAARIAAEAMNDPQLHETLSIQAVGIVYSDMQTFRSSVTLHVGSPVQAKEFFVDDDPRVGIRLLTERLEGELKQLCWHMEDPRIEQLIQQIAYIFPEYGEDDHARLHDIAGQILAYTKRGSQLPEALMTRVADLARLNRAMNQCYSDSGFSWFERILTVLFSPFVLLGGVVFFMPYVVTGLFTNRMARNAIEVATYKFCAGVVLFLLWFMLILSVTVLMKGSLVTALLVGVVLIISGLAHLRFWDSLRALLLFLLWPTESSPVHALAELRASLKEELIEMASNG